MSWSTFLSSLAHSKLIADTYLLGIYLIKSMIAYALFKEFFSQNSKKLLT